MRHAASPVVRLALAFAAALPACAPAGAAFATTRPAEPPAPAAVPVEPATSPAARQGLELVLKREFARACDVLRPAVDADPMDHTARACYATALAGSGQFVQARQQASVYLSWRPNTVDGYVVRATAAAEMGDAGRANRDLEVARLLDPADATGQIAGARERRARALADLPNESAVTLHAKLLQGARDGEPMEQLATRAAWMLKASNANRLLGDEVYSDKRRRLAWAALAEPRDPSRLSDVGRFLIDELEARFDEVEPGHRTYYRLQNKGLKGAEREMAIKMYKAALAVDPGHVPALAGLARLDLNANMFANAEHYLRRAVATGTSDPNVLKMMSEVMRAAGSQRAARAIGIRWVTRWEERIGDTVYEYSEAPTAEGLAVANTLEGQAGNFYGISRDYLRRALQTRPNDAATYDFVAEMAWCAQDYAAAARSWERAIKFDPDTIAYRYGLANAHGKLNDVDGYLREATAARNLEHTTAGTQLGAAFKRIESDDLGFALDLLARAVEVDPGDPRTIAYMAVIADAKGQRDEAQALYRAAFALDEAHARQRGGSWIASTGTWYVSDTGRPVELRRRIAERIAETDPARAAELYLENVEIETRFADTALNEFVFPATLPTPPSGPRPASAGQTFAGTMRTNRAMAAVMLVRLKKYDEAAAHFRKLFDYEARAKAAGGKAYQQPTDEVWKSQPVAAAAVECFERVKDPQQLYGWKNLLNRPPPEPPLDSGPPQPPRSLRRSR